LEKTLRKPPERAIASTAKFQLTMTTNIKSKGIHALIARQSLNFMPKHLVKAQLNGSHKTDIAQRYSASG